MNCPVPFERITQVGWLETTANTGYLYDNRNGAAFIALGSQDNVGAYVIVPQSSNQSSLRPYVVAAGAPFVGQINGPFTLFPIATHTFTPSIDSVCDVLVFESMPPWFPNSRAPLIAAVFGTASANGSVALSVNVRGRRRVQVAIRPNTIVSTGETFSVNGYMVAAPIPGAAGYNAQVQSGTYAAVVATKVVEFYPTAGPPAGAWPGADVLDFVEVYNTTHAENTDTYTILVQAWD